MRCAYFLLRFDFHDRLYKIWKEHSSISSPATSWRSIHFLLMKKSPHIFQCVCVCLCALRVLMFLRLCGFVQQLLKVKRACASVSVCSCYIKACVCVCVFRACVHALYMCVLLSGPPPPYCRDFSSHESQQGVVCMQGESLPSAPST